MITPFYMKFITHAQEILNKAGYRVTLAQSHEDPEAERLNLQMMEDYRVEGILISVCHDKKNREFYQNFLDKGIPLVFFDRTVEDISAPKVKRSEEHTSELQSRQYLVCRLLLEKKKNKIYIV